MITACQVLHVRAPAQDTMCNVGQNQGPYSRKYAPFEGVVDKSFYPRVGVDDLDSMQVCEGLQTFDEDWKDSGDSVFRERDCDDAVTKKENIC